MDFLFKALFVAAVTWAVGWLIVEFLAVREETSGPSGPSSGVETAIGKPAVVIKAFAPGVDGKLRGRVRFEGEDWKAVYTGDAASPPAKHDHVTITEIDTARLEAQVN